MSMQPPATPSGSTSGAGTPRTSMRPRRPASGAAAGPSSSAAASRLARGGTYARTTAPRLRLNLNAGPAAGSLGGEGTGPKTAAYMQGYDRELDSSDDETGEGLAFEEQLVLRMPPGAECERLRDWVRRREIGKEGAQVELKFKDSRRAVFRLGDSLFAAKLVDLPTILETHKTLDNRQMFKIADISQMLVVTHRVGSEAEATRAAPAAQTSATSGGVRSDAGAGEYVWDSGLTPPMHLARKRRFRKRANKRIIETVEKEVERLLKDDQRAERVEYEMMDAAMADLSEDEGDGEGGQASAADGAAGGDDDASAMGDEASMFGDQEDRDDMEDERMEDEGAWDDEGTVGEVDHALAAELEAAMAADVSDSESDSSSRTQSRRATSEDVDGDLWGEDEGDDSGGDDDDGAEDEDLDEEEIERRVRESQLEGQCRDMDAHVKRKQAEANATPNALIRKRQLEALKRLMTERDLKAAQLEEVRAERRERAAESAAAAAAAAAASATPDPSDADQETAKADGPPQARDAGSASVSAADGERNAAAVAVPAKGKSKERSDGVSSQAVASDDAAHAQLVDQTASRANSDGNAGAAAAGAAEQ